MQSQLPTAEEAFGLPTAEQAFGNLPEYPKGNWTFDGQFMDEQFGQGSSPGYILDVFGQGAKRGWGAQPADIGPETQQFLKDIGVFNDYAKGRGSLIKQFNESLLRGTALAAHGLIRGSMALAYGLGDIAVTAGVPRDIPGMLEAFPAGRLTGLPTRIPLLERAADLDALPGRGADVTARERFAPMGEETPTERVVAPEPSSEAPTTAVETAPAPEPNLVTQPQDVHTIARLIAPDIFREYDALTEQHAVLSRWIDELQETRRQDPRVAKAEQEINTILERVRGVEERLTKRAATRLEEVRDDLDNFLRTDTPDMQRVRKAREEVDYKMRDLSPDVSEAYREAQRQMPVEEPPALVEARDNVVEFETREQAAQRIAPNLPPVPEGFVRFYHGGAGPINEPRFVSDDIRYAQGYANKSGSDIFYTDIPKDSPLLKKAFEDEGTDQVSPYVHFEAPPEGFKPVNEPRQAAEIENLSQRRIPIARDIENQLVAVGRSQEEARAAGALVQAHYEARAARFNGALGRARDLYERDDPIISRGEGSQRGQLNLARNEIKLFANADASTFVHETAHNWLQEMRRDAEHPAAPQDLKSDLEAVKGWLGVEGDNFTRTQHEKFARGFERYLMEGQAPTSKLAQVFDKFKQWLTQIYQTISRLRSPITDDIRGVYDRLLSTPSREPVIVPEREGAVDFATAHEQAAREVPAADALDAADRIRAERDRVAEILSAEVDRARRDARRGPTRTIVAGEGEAAGRVASVREEPASADVAVDTGRTEVKGKSEKGFNAQDRFTEPNSDYLDRVGNIRIENLNVPEDVAAAIRDAAGEKDGFLTARRGELSDDEVVQLADDLGMRTDRLDRRKVGEAFNAEEIIAARRLLVRSAENVRDTMQAAANGTEKGLIDYALARERHLLIQEQVAGITAEAGRALRAFRSLKGQVGDAELLSELFQKTLGKNSAELQKEAQLGLTLDSRAKVTKFVRDASSPTWKDKVVEAWINSLLSGPYTHVRNLTGNSTVAANSILETGIAAAINRLRGHRDIDFAEVRDRIEGLIQGSQEGVIAFGKALKDETITFEGSRPTEKYGPAIGGKLGEAIRLPGRFLAAEDELFKAVAFRQEMNVQARRAASAEGLEGPAREARIADLLRDPTDLMVEEARKHAEYQTFTNPLGKVGRQWTQLVDAHPLLRLLFPFNRTPINIMKYAIERTPAGLLFKDVWNNISGKNGPIARDTQMARLVLGSTYMAGVVGLTLAGFLTGGGPWKREDKEVWQLDGKRPYSVRIGDTWYSIQNIDPLSITTGLASDLADIAKYGTDILHSKDGAELDKLAFMTMTAFSRDIFNKTSFRGAANLFQAITDSQGSATKFLNQLAASTVPAAIGQMAQMEDPVKRDVRNPIDAWRARLPFERERMMPSRNMWGEPVLETNLGPISTSLSNNDPINALMTRLEMSKALPQRKIRGVELTPQQYDDYTRIDGRMAKIMLDQELPYLRQMPDGLAKKEISDTINKARELASVQVFMGSMGTTDDLVKKSVEKKLEVLR